jgi:hypothetical protein
MSSNFTNRKTGYLTEEEHKLLIDKYNNGTLEPTSKEKLIVNPKVAYEVTNEMIQNSIPKNIKEYKNMYGEINRFSKVSPVSNLLWEYFYFVNPDVFRPAAILFEKSLKKGGTKRATYCSYPKGTTAYKKFWKQEFKRCTEGYEPLVDGKPCGLKINGEFYFYLNYGRINKIVEYDDGKTESVEGFPDFLSMDYYYYKELYARENPHEFGLEQDYKRSMILVKARRAGFSFKAASSSVWIIAFNNKAKVAIASAPDTYQTDAALCAKKAIPIVDHLSKYTPFGRQSVGDVKLNGGWKNEVASITKTHVSLTLGIYNTRTKEKAGRQSSLVTMALSKDDAASGEGLRRLYFEEGGKTSNLNKAWGFARESMKAGSHYRGLAVLFGCFTGDTMVFNNYGKAIQIKDLNPHNGIVGFSSKNLLPQTINALKVPIEKECVKLKTQYGTITASIDHPMLVTWADNTNHNYHIDKEQNDPTANIRNYRTLSCWYERADRITKEHALLIPDLTKINTSFLFGNINLNKHIKHKDNYKLNVYMDYLKKHNKLHDDVWKLNKQSTWFYVSALFDYFGNGDYQKVDSYHKGTLPIYYLKIGNKGNLYKEIKMLLYKLGVLAFTKGDDQGIKNLTGKGFKKIYDILSKNDLYIISPIETIKEFVYNTSFQAEDLRNASKNFSYKMLSKSLDRSLNREENANLPRDFRYPNKVVFRKDYTCKENDMYSDTIQNVFKFKIITKPKRLKEKQIVYNLNCSPNHNYLAGGYIAGNTGGEMVTDGGSKGRSRAFANLFNNPEANDLAGFENIYDYQPTNMKCGFFVSAMWNNFGAKIKINGDTFLALNKQGNAFFWVAELALNKLRKEIMPPKGSQKDYNLFITQRCKTPSEAFFATKGSVFNTADLIAVQSSIQSSKYGFAKYYTAGELIENEEGIINFKPDLENKLQPIVSMDYDNNNKEGALIVYEQPKKIEGVVPNDAYIITCDPIGQNTSSGKSLVSIYVVKTPVYSMYDGFGYEGIVASYIGRKQYNPMTYARELLLKLSKFYNAKITYENDRDGGILQFFTNKNELNRLLPTPQLVMNKHLPNSSTRLRTFGHSMATQHHKTMGETLLNEWLDYRHPTIKGLNYKDEYVEKIGPRNMDLLKDQMLLEQLIAYNRQGNFDAPLAFMGAIIQIKELYDVNLLSNQKRTKETASAVKRWVNRVLKTNSYRPNQFEFID